MAGGPRRSVRLGDLRSALERVELIVVPGCRLLFLEDLAGLVGKPDLQGLARWFGMRAANHDDVGEDLLEPPRQCPVGSGRAAEQASQEPPWPVCAKEPQRLRRDAVTETGDRGLFQSIAPAVEAGLYLVPRVLD